MTGYAIASIVWAVLALVLALRAYRSHGMSFENTAWMAVAWVVIIGVLAFVAGRIAG